MLMPSEEEIRLNDIIKNGTYEEALKADKELTELLQKKMEEEKKNPSPWGDLML